ncbi:hypothetical protein, partial [Sulfuricaulis sp.]|uniref:hypothetical protein n=1 Tax=Sulfuricaulis sp. TaxID=2003553 RepID=UPI00355A0E1F
QLGPQGIGPAVAIRAVTACAYSSLGLTGRDIAAYGVDRRNKNKPQTGGRSDRQDALHKTPMKKRLKPLISGSHPGSGENQGGLIYQEPASRSI